MPLERDRPTHLVVPLVAGTRLRVQPPEGAAREPDAALPDVDLANLPGARVAAKLGYRSDAIDLRAMCVAAPSNGWAPGVESLVLARATQIARGAVGGEVTRFDAHEIAAIARGFDLRFEGDVVRGDEARAVRGRHWLGFAGDARDAVVCTVICTEAPRAARACDALVEASSPEGAWVDAPPPGVLTRAILLAAEWPSMTAALLLTLVVAAAALLIAKRPRPRA